MMNTAEHKAFGVRIVGFEPSLRKRIRSVFRWTRSDDWSDLKCKTVPSIEAVNALWIVKINQRNAVQTECLRIFLKQTKHYAPIFLLSNWANQKSNSHALLREWLDLSGARIFEGKNGFDQLWRFLVETAQKRPNEIIVNVKLSDDGLHVWFADNALALIPFTSIRRIAEADDIQWDSIRIAGERTFITLSTSGGEDIPIPHDVLREFVAEEVPKRKVGNIRERKLTAQFFGEKLKAARERQGITQETLASKVDSSRWTIMRIEKGDYLPKVALLEKLAHALEMRVEELLASQ